MSSSEGGNQLQCDGSGGIAKYDISHVNKFLPEKLLESFNASASSYNKIFQVSERDMGKKSIAHSADRSANLFTRGVKKILCAPANNKFCMRWLYAITFPFL